MKKFDNDRLLKIFKSITPEDEIRGLVDLCHTVSDLKAIIRNLKFLPRDKKISKKYDFITIVAKLYSDDDLFNYFIDALGEPAVEIIRLCTWDGMQLGEDIAEVFGIPVNRERHFHTVEFDLPAPFILKQLNGKYIYIDNFLRDLLRKRLINPLEMNMERDEEPGEEIYNKSTGEEFCRNLNPLVQHLQDNGFFKRSYDAKILKSTLKKVQDAGHISPFSFELSNDWGINRHKLLLDFLSFSLSSDTNEIPLTPKLPFKEAEFLKNAVKGYFSSDRSTFDINTLLPGLKVKSKGYYLDQCRNHRQKYMPEYLEIFSGWPHNGWIDMESCMTYFYRTYNACPFIFGRDMYFNEETESSYGSYREKHYLETEYDYREYIYKPWLRALFGIMGAIGLFELAWDFSHKAADNRFTSVKMTPLGRWIFMDKEGFRIKTDSTYKPVKLDEHTLTVFTDTRDKAAFSFFKTIGVSLGGGAFKVSPKLMMHGCRARQDVEDRFESFKRYCHIKSSQKLPLRWQNFYEEVTGCFITLHIEQDWVVFAMNTEDKALANLLTHKGNDLFFRMEGNHFAVRKSQIRKFQNFLKNEGFSPLMIEED